MKAEELRAIMDYLQEKVVLGVQESGGPVTIVFNAPTEEEMTAAGLNPEGAKAILNATWWDEMVEDIVETPDMCEPDDPPAQVLEYARDVVTEYIRKRVEL